MPCKGNDVITNAISANQHFASTFSMQIFKFQRRSCKLSFLFRPRRQRPCSQARAGAAVVLTISSIVLCLCTRLPLAVCVNGKHPSPLPLPQLVLPAFRPPSWLQFLLFPIPRAPFAKIKMDFNYTQQVLHPRSKNTPTPQTNLSLFISNCSLLQF